jgi:hypothetical protein
MVKIIIAAAIVYYLNLDWWWWIGLLIASAIDLYDRGVENINSARTVDKLNELLYFLKNKNDDFEDKE